MGVTIRNTRNKRNKESISEFKNETLEVCNKSVNDIRLISKNEMITYVKDVNNIMNDTIQQVANSLIKYLLLIMMNVISKTMYKDI